jgi:uncharacterized protein with NRDE domain
MCLILFARDAHPEYRLVVAANRDEFYARPTAPAAFWDDAPEVLAGRDLREGGTWLGITRAGRFAAVTNVRDPVSYQTGAPSRGHLVSDFLRNRATPAGYLQGLAPRAPRFNGFNLLLGDGESLAWFSNRGGEGARALGPGVYGLSNHLLDTPWPKVTRGKDDLRRILQSPPDEWEEALFATLTLRDPAPDALLPDTGVGLERERALSAAFIATPEYGTRCSTVLLVGRDGNVTFTERTVNPAAGTWSEVRHRFALDVPVAAD